jgi:hypothetical protein
VSEICITSHVEPCQSCLSARARSPGRRNILTAKIFYSAGWKEHSRAIQATWVPPGSLAVERHGGHQFPRFKFPVIADPKKKLYAAFKRSLLSTCLRLCLKLSAVRFFLLFFSRPLTINVSSQLEPVVWSCKATRSDVLVICSHT